MLPKVVLHKQNGHKHPPAQAGVTPDQVMLMVHSGSGDGAAPGRDLLRFAAMVRTETSHALVEQANRRIDGLRASLADAQGRTQAAFGRGDLADVRATLESIGAEAEAAAVVVQTLMASLPPEAGGHVAVEPAALLERTLAALRPRFEAGPPVVATVEPDLPQLRGDPRGLQRALAGLVAFAAEAVAAAGGAGRVVLEMVRGTARDHARRLVEVRVRAEGSEAPGPADEAGAPIDLRAHAELAVAGHVVTAHGGVVWARRFGPGRVTFVLELPCA